jgi:predicted DNA-binding antitoxin AbrB/MazE fold protein
MSILITAIYEDGILRPLQDINLRDNQMVKLEIIPEAETSLVESQKKALLEIAGIGNSGLTDIARRHDKFLYRNDS